MKHAYILILVLVSITFLPAQEDYLPSQEDYLPEQEDYLPPPELVLPTILLEIQEEEMALMEAPLPAESDAAFSALEVPLPGTEELPFSDIPIVIPEAPGAGGVWEQTVQGNSFFSEGVIGAGTGNHILGDITLYKLGEDPRFQIDFVHEGRDGYAGRDAGEGFSLRKEILSGNMEAGNDRLYYTGKLAYNETARGLQGLSSFSSLTHQSYHGDTLFEYDFSPRWGFKGEARVDYSQSWLSGEEPVRYSELAVFPRAGLVFRTAFMEWGLSAGYRFQDLKSRGTAINPSQMLQAQGWFSLPFSRGWEILGSGGLAWEPDRFLRYPFEVSLKKESGRVFNFLLEGGYRLDEGGMGAFWKEFPFLKPETTSGDSEIIQAPRGWTVSLQGLLTPPGGLTIKAGGRYSLWENAIFPGSAGAEGLYPFDRGELQTLDLNVRGEWEVHPGFLVQAGWSGQMFLETNLLKPEQSFDAEVSLLQGEDRAGVSASALWEVFSREQVLFSSSLVPRLGFSGFYRVTQGIRLILEGEDILAPFLENGRMLWDDYQDTGGSLTLKIGISL